MALEAGDIAPDFSMETTAGPASLSDFRGKRLVLYFYPKDNTSGCTAEAIAFSAEKEAFENAGVTILGVSKDSLKSHEKFISDHTLTIRLASDPEHTVMEAYGAWVEKSMYGRKYMGTERATFLIGADGRIEHVWRKVRVKGHVDAVLARIAALG